MWLSNGMVGCRDVLDEQNKISRPLLRIQKQL
jgi:hypothetical protein